MLVTRVSDVDTRMLYKGDLEEDIEVASRNVSKDSSVYNCACPVNKLYNPEAQTETSPVVSGKTQQPKAKHVCFHSDSDSIYNKHSSGKVSQFYKFWNKYFRDNGFKGAGLTSSRKAKSEKWPVALDIDVKWSAKSKHDARRAVRRARNLFMEVRKVGSGGTELRENWKNR